MKHRRLVSPINTKKHYLPRNSANLANGTSTSDVIVDGVLAPATANLFDVREGSVIKAVWIELWLRGNGATGTTTQFQLVLERVPSGLTSITFTELANQQVYDNKKNILFSSQAILGDLETSPEKILQGWIMIPKGKQRFGLGDRLVLSVGTTGQALQICGMFTYKEYQ